MKTSFVSTPAFASALRLSMRQSQAKLFDAQRELATGRLADVGRTLGHRGGLTVSLRQHYAQLDAITKTNSAVMARLDASQEALGGVLESAYGFLQALILVRDSGSGQGVVARQAIQELAGLTDTMNTVFGGQYLFAGIKTDTAPLGDYFVTPAPASKLAVDTAFLTAFGVSQDNPAVAGITPAQMQSFLDTSFPALFADPQWEAIWSNASSTTVTSRISASESIESSASANETPFRQLARAYTMVADLGTEGLNQSTFQTVIDTAIQLVGSATSGVTAIKARLGTSENRVTRASERMSLQIDILTSRITGLENVDPFEASTRVTQLITQVETGYALTARIQRLGILQYL